MEKEVDDTACCPVCFEHYEETGENVPRLLPCAHLLCHGCVNRLVQRQTLNQFVQRQTLICPQCRQCNEVPPGAVCFPQNKYILKILNLSRNKGCFQVCKRHGREVSLFCDGRKVLFSGSKDCKTEICSLCLTKDHVDHKVVDLLEKREEEIDSLSTDIKDLKNDLEDTKGRLLKAKEEVEEKFKRDAKLLNSRLASCRSLFESRLSQTESLTTNLTRIRKSVDVTVTLETIERKRSQYKNILTKYHETFEDPVKYKSSNVEETEEEITLLKTTKEIELKDLHLGVAFWIWLILIIAVSVLINVGWEFLQHQSKTLHYEYNVETDVDFVKEYITYNIPNFLQEYHRRLQTHTVSSRILLSKEEFYELRRSKDPEGSRAIVTFCLLEIRQCIVEGDTLMFQKITIDWNVEEHPEDGKLTKITTTVNYYASFLFHLIHQNIMKEDDNIFIGTLKNITHSP